MNTENIKSLAEEKLLHTYNRFQIAIDHGEGVYLYDTDGKKYLDFQAGIAVYSLGYSNDRLKNAMKNQIDKVMHISNLYYSEPMASAAKKLCEAADMDRVFFTNSGTEAIEGLLKVAKKYAFTKDGTTDHEIIAMEHSFHGRSLGALSVTGNAHYREAFEPLLGGIKFAEYNNIDSVKALINDKTCAILLETLQGEGGIYPADEAFIKELRKICDEKDILLLLDEIQCGMGRTGEMFAYMHYGIKPDAMSVAKAIGNGASVGAFLMSEKVAKNSLVPGDHGTTYGGNPFVCAAVDTVLDIFKEDKIVDHVKEVSAYLVQRLDAIANDFDCVVERRGLGLMQGLQVLCKPADVIAKCQQKGLMIISAGSDVLRFVPPLIIEKEHVDEMEKILREALSEI